MGRVRGPGMGGAPWLGGVREPRVGGVRGLAW